MHEKFSISYYMYIVLSFANYWDQLQGKPKASVEECLIFLENECYLKSTISEMVTYGYTVSFFQLFS